MQSSSAKSTSEHLLRRRRRHPGLSLRAAVPPRGFRSPMANFESDGIQNLAGFDAFKDADEEAGDQSKVHIRVQQRNGRKCITTVQGLADDLDIKRICKAFKKNFQCNGAVTKDSELGEIVQLSGDQRTNVSSFLTEQEICKKAQVVIHGF